MEGYLFPSTYQFAWQMNEEEIIAKQMETSNKIFSEFQIENVQREWISLCTMFSLLLQL